MSFGKEVKVRNPIKAFHGGINSHVTNFKGREETPCSYANDMNGGLSMEGTEPMKQTELLDNEVDANQE